MPANWKDFTVFDDKVSKFFDEGDAEPFDIAGPVLPEGAYAGATVVRITKFTAPYNGIPQALYRWEFTVPTDTGAVQVSGASSRATGPSSKLVRWSCAALGREVVPGERIDPAMLYGRLVQVVIEVKGGFSRVTDVLAMPRSPRAVRPPAPAPDLDSAPVLDAGDLDDLEF